ncbi:hypothetical protein SAMN04488515_3018 [Cognatiyoonia koreensis]|uniref:Sulfotransferase family protein n=2 Tax=Cognatiyoonia koreensis TaxID=364200 RepID=A0A1I0RNX4_9RHOB|nr:hypothetical protein SAMN04488515_3018 [Cognatiyoonia koreensis]
MWSGPRNLSTAMMYSFGNRADFAVWDEPFYAPYLATSDYDHPMKDEIIASHEANAETVASLCLDSIPDQKPHFYMKHMPHHMLDPFPRDWIRSCVNVHLIRHPARVIASYGNKRAQITSEDIGFQQQLALYRAFGGVVIDSADIRKNPKEMLQILCDIIGLDFDDAMLSWPSGPRPFDGVWATHWYDAVHKSTGFAGAEGPLPDVGEDHHLLQSVMPAYEEMAKDAI